MSFRLFPFPYSGLDYEEDEEEEGDDSVFTSEEKAGESGKPTTADATSELGKTR